MKALIDKKDFIGLDRCLWLYSGAETPTHRGVLEAVTEYLTARSLGPGGRERNAEKEWRCKQNLARMLNGSPEQIALMSSSSEVISMIAQAMRLKPGDNVIIHNLEFPSGVLPWLLLKREGVEVRVVEHRQWDIEEEDILNRIDERTRLVLTSHVSYLNGVRIDYKKLYERVSRTNALFVLDATQSLGAFPVDLNYADLIVCSSYKWLLGVHGGGILAVNPKRGFELVPRYIGWGRGRSPEGRDKFETFEFHSDARRFELGYPGYPAVYALEFTTGLLLDIGVERIAEHILKLGESVLELLGSLGVAVTTPAESHRRAGNISFLHHDAERIAGELYKQGVYLMGSDGRVRISVGAFNDAEDIRLLGERLPQIIENIGGDKR